ncbi:MAG TPA: DUF4097 family beta strand repeat-containing protein [Candidatus Lumbricidophila sp.]|nr:DUF4097 family beta strand repeat-containing protein [Candidatus Lumbricidophila sp.]
MPNEKWLIAPGESRVIDVELVRSLKISLLGGKVDVIAHDEPGARIEVNSVSGRDLLVEIDGDQLIVDHPQRRWDNFIEVFKSFVVGNTRAEVSILAPRAVALKLGVVSGDALISGFTTDGKFSTVSGDITVDNVSGNIELSSVSGEVSAGDHLGRVVAHSVSGDVVASGQITRLSADTVSGNVMVDAHGVPDRIDSNTVSGDLTVRYVAGNGARYRANTVSGAVLLDNVSIKRILGTSYEHVTGTLEGAWLDLSANSVSGDISVIARPAEASAPSTNEPSGASL